MKQRIGVEQLQELSQEQRERLRKWWFRQEIGLYQPMANPYGKKFFLSGLNNGYLAEISDCLPLLSIGQCIELLFEKDFITFRKVISNWLEPKITMTLIDDGPKEYKPFCQIQRTELIDALWEAVKCVLGKEAPDEQGD